MAIRTMLFCGLTGSALVVSSIALADGAAPASAATASTPAYSALPQGSVTSPPKDKAPKRIPKTEKVEGFAVGDPPKSQLRDGKITNVVIFAKESDATDYTAGKSSGFSGRMGVEGQCFARRSQRGFGDEESSTEWAFDMEPVTRINAPWKPPPPLPKGQKPTKSSFASSLGEMEVTAVHQERFVLENGKGRIEMTDAWVDPVTHGVRLISKATLPLARIGAAPSGVTLYGARGDKVLHVVARREKPTDAADHPPTSPRDFRMLSATRMPLMVQTSDGQNDATQCSFAHLSLKTLKGASEMASFETQAVFMDEPKGEKADEDALIAVMRGTHEDEPELRVRPLRATVSTTWGSRDKEPVLSVSFGWMGRERSM